MMLIESVAFLCVCGYSDKGKLKGKKGVISEAKNLPGLEYIFLDEGSVMFWHLHHITANMLPQTCGRCFKISKSANV